MQVQAATEISRLGHRGVTVAHENDAESTLLKFQNESGKLIYCLNFVTNLFVLILILPGYLLFVTFNSFELLYNVADLISLVSVRVSSDWNHRVGCLQSLGCILWLTASLIHLIAYTLLKLRSPLFSSYKAKTSSFCRLQKSSNTFKKFIKGWHQVCIHTEDRQGFCYSVLSGRLSQTLIYQSTVQVLSHITT